MCIKSEFKEICLKLATNGRSDKGFLLTSKVCSQGVFLSGAIYIYRTFKMCFKSYFKEIVLKHAANGQSDKGFLLTSTFVPKGLSAPILGLYTCIKALKYVSGPGVRWACTGPLVLWLWRTDKNYPLIIIKLPSLSVLLVSCLITDRQGYCHAYL